MKKKLVLRIRKDYHELTTPIYVPEYYRVGIFSSGWVGFMINESHIAKPLCNFNIKSLKTLSNIETAKRHLTLYREIYLDDKVVYEVSEKGVDDDGV